METASESCVALVSSQTLHAEMVTLKLYFTRRNGQMELTGYTPKWSLRKNSLHAETVVSDLISHAEMVISNLKLHADRVIYLIGCVSVITFFRVLALAFALPPQHR